VVLKGQSYAFPLLDECFEGAAFDMLHADDEALVGLKEGIKFDDVSMVNCCEYLCLLGEESLS
jgi:hypothetical protein